MSKRQRLWAWIKATAKDPLTLILFAICWLSLESPAIFGGIAYIVTKAPKWLALAGGWIALTAPPLPIPVVPISIAFAVGGRKIIRLLQNKINNNRR